MQQMLTVQFVQVVLVLAATVWIVVEETGRRIVPDGALLILLASWALSVAWIAPLLHIVMAALIAVVIFGLGVLAFSRGMMGGGDVKLASIVVLSIDPFHLLQMIIVFYGLVLGYILMRVFAILVVASESSKMRSLRDEMRNLPLGIPLSMCLLVYTIMPFGAF